MNQLGFSLGGSRKRPATRTLSDQLPGPARCRVLEPGRNKAAIDKDDAPARLAQRRQHVVSGDALRPDRVDEDFFVVEEHALR